MWRKIAKVFLICFIIFGNLFSIATGLMMGLSVFLIGSAVSLSYASEDVIMISIIIAIIYFVIHAITGFIIIMVLATVYGLFIEMADNIAKIEENTRPRVIIPRPAPIPYQQNNNFKQ